MFELSNKGDSMKFKPLHDRVVVKRLESDEKSSGGIIIPDTAKEKPSAVSYTHLTLPTNREV